MSTTKEEPLTKENPHRFVMFPIKHQDIWDLYKKSCSNIWFCEELDLNQDLIDWQKLSENEQYFIKNVLAFFAASDGIVNENLAERFMNEVQFPELRALYGFQIAVESIHSECYSLLIDTYINDNKEKERLFRAIDTIPCVAKKAKWALKWIADKESPLAMRLLAFAIVEGIFFSGSFCSIFWLKHRGLMPGLTFSNELISRDEGLHTDTAVLLYNNYIVNKLDQKVVHQMFKEAVEHEIEFITESIPCNLIGMNANMMKQYIQFVGDYLLTQLKFDKIWKVHNPFPFMESISLDTKTNFFEARNSSYSKAGIAVENKEDMSFGLDGDF
jgi:ribonucleotide reductase beta subunit family protein with ferritin-like domain